MERFQLAEDSSRETPSVRRGSDSRGRQGRDTLRAVHDDNRAEGVKKGRTCTMGSGTNDHFRLFGLAAAELGDRDGR